MGKMLLRIYVSQIKTTTCSIYSNTKEPRVLPYSCWLASSFNNHFLILIGINITSQSLDTFFPLNNISNFYTDNKYDYMHI